MFKRVQLELTFNTIRLICQLWRLLNHIKGKWHLVCVPNSNSLFLLFRWKKFLQGDLAKPQIYTICTILEAYHSVRFTPIDNFCACQDRSTRLHGLFRAYCSFWSPFSTIQHPEKVETRIWWRHKAFFNSILRALFSENKQTSRQYSVCTTLHVPCTARLQKNLSWKTCTKKLGNLQVTPCTYAYLRFLTFYIKSNVCIEGK